MEEKKKTSAAGDSLNGFITKCVLDRLEELESQEGKEDCPFL